MRDFSRLMVAALRQHLDMAMPPRVPAGGELLWSWFSDLSGARSYHAAGPNPIGWADIAGYCTMMRVPMQPHHIATLLAMDRAFLECCRREEPAAPSGVKTSPRISTQPLSAALFDAMFG